MTELRKPIIAGNWKMFFGPSQTREFLGRFLGEHASRDDRTIAFFPSAISFSAAREAARSRPDVLFGVQNIYWEPKGAFTGETSAEMAVDAGATLVLVGHSERRHVFGETSEQTALKVRSVLDAGLTPVLCVGETRADREAGNARSMVDAQLRAVFGGLSSDDARRVAIAYEPVWAIGTGLTASPADAAEMHGEIRAFLVERCGSELADEAAILYGGSVKPENAEALLAAENVDGVLVGGASLEPLGFARICAVPVG